MWRPTVSSDEIYHHGIMGMHWGQRNGPPYPLKAGAHTAEEKKAKYAKRIIRNEKAANRYRAKAAKLRVKAAKLNRRRLFWDDTDTTFFSKARRANRKELKAAKLERKAARRERTALALKKKMSDIDIKAAAEAMNNFGANQGKKTWAEKRAEAKKQKQRMKNLKKARDVRQKNKEMAERKEEILRKGSAADVRKIRDQLTEEDYRRVFNRLDNENKLDQRINANVRTGKERFNEYVQTVQSVANATTNAVNIYNNVAKTYNTFNKTGKKLPTIGGPTKEEKFKTFLTDRADLNTLVNNMDKLNNKELNMALNRFQTKDKLLEYYKNNR